METLIKVSQFLLSLSILIALHEWGHFFFAKLFKTRVNKFYLFFDFLFPMPNVLNFALFKKKKGETEYGIGWFPLGGYVQIDGMMDETQDAEKLKAPPQPWEFRSKPAWQRLLIMMGGILVNVVLAFLIYAMVLFVWGKERTLNSSVKNGMVFQDSLIKTYGFKNGDKILAINNKPVEYFEEINKRLIIGTNTAKVLRNNADTVFVTVPSKYLEDVSDKSLMKRGLTDIRLPALVGKFDKNDTSAAAKAGLLEGDFIEKADTVAVNYQDELRDYFDTKKAGDTITLTVKRNNTLLNIKAPLDANKRIGISRPDDEVLEKLGYFKTIKKEYGFFESIPAGVSLTFETLSDYITQFKLMVTTKLYKKAGGFASMTKAFTPKWNWRNFWYMTGFFSIALAFMNFLPIPMLDGGYILFTLFEIITGKKVPDRFLEKANMVGFFIIIGLMLFTNGNDIYRAITGK